MRLTPLPGSSGEHVTQASAAVGCTELAEGDQPHVWSP